MPWRRIWELKKYGSSLRLFWDCQGKPIIFSLQLFWKLLLFSDFKYKLFVFFAQFAHRDCIQRWCDEKGNTTCEICLQVWFWSFGLYELSRKFSLFTIIYIWIWILRMNKYFLLFKKRKRKWRVSICFSSVNWAGCWFWFWGAETTIASFLQFFFFFSNFWFWSFQFGFLFGSVVIFQPIFLSLMIR